MFSFKMIIPPYENAALLGLRLSYDSGAFNFKFQSVIKVRLQKQWDTPPENINIGKRFSNFLKFNISNNSPSNNNLRSKEYMFINKDIAKNLPIFESKNFSARESLRISMNLKEEISPRTLIELYPYEFNLLLNKFPKSMSPNIPKKWTKLKSNNGIFIGQINNITGELEGRGVFFWNMGVKYLGYFSNNYMQGKGIILDKNNKIKFEGNFYANKKNGFGRFYYNDNEYYEGDFINDIIEGNGLYHFKNGDIWEGKYKNKKKDGVGIWIRKDGEIFLTQYENDNFMGSVQLNNDEINYIQNLRRKDRTIFQELMKTNSMDNKFIVNIKKHALIAAFQLYNKKRQLISSIKFYK